MLYFRQLLAGRDFAAGDTVAEQMANFCYLIGDTEARECVVVDPAWDVQGLIDIARADDMKVVGALATHYHPDHVGGSMFGYTLEGLARFLEVNPAKVYVNKHEALGVSQVAGVSKTDLTVVESDDKLVLGGTEIRFIHTPGHTPGSQCFLVQGEALVAGDTLFVGGCGRVDLPGGNPEQMYHSLTQKLVKLDDNVLLCPGHHYGPVKTRKMGEEKRENPYLHAGNLSAWLRTRGV